MVSVEEGLPEFCTELQDALRRQGLSDLADQLPSAQIMSRCGCDEAGCGSFGVKSSRPLNVVEQNIIGVRHGRSHKVEGIEGLVVVDVDQFGRLTGVEVLDRLDVEVAVKNLHVPSKAG